MSHPKSAFFCTSPVLMWVSASCPLSKAIYLWFYMIKLLPAPSFDPNIEEGNTEFSPLQVWAMDRKRCWKLLAATKETRIHRETPRPRKCSGQWEPLQECVGDRICWGGNHARKSTRIEQNWGYCVGGAPSSHSTQNSGGYQRQVRGGPTGRHRRWVKQGSSYETVPDLSM